MLCSGRLIAHTDSQQIDFGEETGPRTVVSGLVNYIPIEDMRDKYLVGVVSPSPFPNTPTRSPKILPVQLEAREHARRQVLRHGPLRIPPFLLRCLIFTNSSSLRQHTKTAKTQESSSYSRPPAPKSASASSSRASRAASRSPSSTRRRRFSRRCSPGSRRSTRARRRGSTPRRSLCTASARRTACASRRASLARRCREWGNECG